MSKYFNEIDSLEDRKNQAKIYRKHGILNKWHDKEWEDFTNDPRAKEVIQKYIANSKTAMKDGVGFYLYGANGTGKTLLLNLAFQELLKMRYNVQIISFSGLITKFTGSWFNDEERKEMMTILQKVHFLAIEELGKEFSSKNSELGLTVLDNVLRYRLQMNKPTWVTSNLSPKELGLKYSEDVASMFREMCVPLVVKGDDFRSKISEDLKEKYK